jgi:hypothetical protein
MTSYNKIHKMIKTIAHDENKLDLWNECCQELGFQRVKKGTVQYDTVKELYQQKREASLSPSLRKWLKCQEEVGLKGIIVKRDTPEHQMILDRFRETN